ncbi:MAG TPA: BrnT family toxin [Casimicrobiaceae bacterium]
MAYEWNPAKNLANLAKHGRRLCGAIAVFEDDLALTRPHPDLRGEHHFLTLGVDAFGRHLVVVFTERAARIRVISARLATKQERKTYETGV